MARSARIDVDTSTSAIYGYEVLIAFGAGSFVQASFAVIQTIVTPAEMSYGITLMLVGTCSEGGSAFSKPLRLLISANASSLYLAQLSGLTLGLSVAGSVFENLAQTDLATLLSNVSREEVQQLVSGTSSTLFESLPSDVRAQALAIIVRSLRTT